MGRFTYTIEDRTGTRHYGSASSVADARALADFHDPNPGSHPRVVILREGRKGSVTEVPRIATPRIREKASGHYSYEGRWERLCVCEHKLGSHAGEAPHPCFYGTGLADDPPGAESCECERFRPTKRKPA